MGKKAAREKNNNHLRIYLKFGLFKEGSKLWVTIMTKTLEMGQEKDKVKGLDHEKEKRKEKKEEKGNNRV